MRGPIYKDIAKARRYVPGWPELSDLGLCCLGKQIVTIRYRYLSVSEIGAFEFAWICCFQEHIPKPLLSWANRGGYPCSAR